MTNPTIQATAALACTVALLLSAACGTPSTTASPLQISYQALAATQATLLQIETNSVEAVKYKTQINSVIASYNLAETAFQAAYATKNGNDTQLATDTALLADQVALLVSTFAPKAMNVRFSTKAIKTRSVDPKVSLADILTILTIAAQAAQSIPVASPYAGLASLILQAADAGILAYKGASNGINPATLSVLALLQ